MNVVERALQGQRVFAELPAATPDWVAVVEVLAQEGLKAVAFHCDDLEVIADAVALFGRRARVGAWGAVSSGQVAAVVDAGVHFVTSPCGLASVADAAGDVPFIAGALTPTEILAAPAEAVQVVPADVLGMAYARGLKALVGERVYVATGRLERFQCEIWLSTGAAAVGVAGETLLGAAADLGVLRENCRSYATL